LEELLSPNIKSLRVSPSDKQKSDRDLPCGLSPCPAGFLLSGVNR
jgi:hypothetical protein